MSLPENVGHFQKLPFLIRCLCFVRVLKFILELVSRGQIVRRLLMGNEIILWKFSTHYFIVYCTGSCCQPVCIDLHKQMWDPERFSQRKCPSDSQCYLVSILAPHPRLSFFPSITLFKICRYNCPWLTIDCKWLQVVGLEELVRLPSTSQMIGWVTGSLNIFYQYPKVSSSPWWQSANDLRNAF